MPAYLLDQAEVKGIEAKNTSYAFSLTLHFATSEDNDVNKTPALKTRADELRSCVMRNSGVQYAEINETEKGEYKHCIHYSSKTKDYLKAVVGRIFAKGIELSIGKAQILSAISALNNELANAKQN